MTLTCVRGGSLVLALLPVLVSCASVPGGYGGPPPSAPAPPGGAPPVGTLTDIRGPNAYYQRGGTGPAARAYDGLPVYAGDRIYTGEGTRMTLRFSQGGHAELDERTDPVPRFLADLGCLIVDLLRTGRMFVDGSAVCVGAVGTIARQDSQVVYDVRPGYAQITVAGGRAEVWRPRRIAVPAGWRVDANARALVSGGAYQLTRRQVEDAVRWTQWYQRSRPALPGTAERGPADVPPATRPLIRVPAPADEKSTPARPPVQIIR